MFHLEIDWSAQLELEDGDVQKYGSISFPTFLTQSPKAN